MGFAFVYNDYYETLAIAKFILHRVLLYGNMGTNMTVTSAFASGGSLFLASRFICISSCYYHKSQFSTLTIRPKSASLTVSLGTVGNSFNKLLKR